MSEIDELQAAGFTADEIGEWATQQRATLSAAGFKDNEIEAYFAGSVTVPDTVPQSVVRRMQAGTEVSGALQNMRKVLGGNITDRIGAALMEGGAAGWGESPVGLPEADVKKLQDAGVFAKPDEPYNLVSGIRFMNEAMIRPGYAAVETLFRGVNAAIYGVGAAGGQVAAEVTGGNEAEQARARRDGAQIAFVSTMLTAGQPMMRMGRAATGEIRGEPIGPLPKADDFVASSRAIGEDASMVRQEKLLEMYEKQGAHPAEVAADAAADPVLKQRILSSERADVPEGYAPPRSETVVEINGKKTVLRDGVPVEPPPPPKPPKAPEPPAPGSFEEAQGKILDKISVGERGERPMSLSRLYTETIDDLYPIKGVSEDAYQIARLTRGQFGKADTFINNGTFDYTTLKTTGKPLREVLEPVRDDLDGFRAYLASKRALEVEGSGRQSGFDAAAAQEVVNKGEAKYGTAATELVAYQNEVLRYLKDSGVLSERAYGAMVEANKAYVPFYRVFGEEAGGPGGGGKALGPGNPVKKLKGSERGIVDPIESVIKNTYAYISVAERNAAGVKIVEALEAQGLKAKTVPRTAAEADLVDYLKQNGVRDPEALIDFVKQSAADDGTAISAWRDGKRISVTVDDADLVAAFRGLDQQSAGMIARVFAVPASSLRAGAVLTPEFMARNLVRDFMTAFVNSKGLFSPIDTLKGFKSAVAKDDVYWNWKKAGGDNATMVALDRRYLQENITKLTADTGLGTRAWNVVTNPLAGLRMVSELTEQATRLGEFQKVLKGMETKEMMQTAAYTSREVTLDFSRVGAKMRAYNMVTAFANAQIQGVDRIVRAGIDRPLNTTLKIAGGVTMPSVLLWWANHGDPRYEELPDWQKDLFWIILTDKWEPISPLDAQNKPEHLVRQRNGRWEVNNGHIWRVPKPFEVGVIFGSGVERTLSATIGKDKEAFDGFAKSVVNMLTPSVVPTAAVPVFEQWANRSSFTDRTLIPAPAEKLLPEYQYTPYTTELSKALGRVVASFPGLREASVEEGAVGGAAARAVSSPILIENYLRGWTGGLGVYALNIADAGLRKSGVLPDPVTPTPTLADIPFVKAFAVRYPSASAESIQKFYDEYGRDKRYFDSWMAKAKEGDADAMQRIEAAGGPSMFLRLDAFRQALTEHSALVRDIYKAPDIPAEEKRQLIDGLYYAMIELGRAGRDAIKQGRAALDKPAQ